MMKNFIKLAFIFILIATLSSCGIFKKGCQCPKFNQQKIPAGYSFKK